MKKYIYLKKHLKKQNAAITRKYCLTFVSVANIKTSLWTRFDTSNHFVSVFYVMPSNIPVLCLLLFARMWHVPNKQNGNLYNIMLKLHTNRSINCQSILHHNVNWIKLAKQLTWYRVTFNLRGTGGDIFRHLPWPTFSINHLHKFRVVQIYFIHDVLI